jgi:hypothetical protein
MADASSIAGADCAAVAPFHARGVGVAEFLQRDVLGRGARGWSVVDMHTAKASYNESGKEALEEGPI